MENYKKYTDEQLVEMYKGGDRNAFDEINERYKLIVKIEANKFFLQGGNKDDLLQEGTIGLAKAVYGYDKSTLFKTYASKCIRNNIINLVEKNSNKKSSIINRSVSLETEEVLNIAVKDPLTEVIENESENEFIANAKKELSPLEIKVFEYALEGYGYTEIATLLNREPKSIDNALQRIKNKLKRN